MKRPVPDERSVQRAILRLAAVAAPDVLLAHVPNGAHLAGDDRARFKQMGALLGDGLRKGFPDLIALWNRGAALMEVKRPGGRVSPDQKAMHARLAELGWPVAIVTSPDEALAFLESRGAPVRRVTG